MSYPINSFDPKSSRARENERLAKIGYKTPKKGVKKFSSVCVSLPRIVSISDDQLKLLIPHIQNLLESAQDSIIRNRFEEGAQFITDSDVSIQNCIDYLDADARGDRLTAELVKEWFDSAIADNLIVALGDKFGISDEPTEAETKRLNQAITVYRDKFASMAGGRTVFSPDVAVKLGKVLELDDTDTAITVRFANRLKKMAETPADDLMGL